MKKTGFLVRNSVVAKVVLPQKGLNVNKEGVKEDLMTNQETLIGEIHVLVGPMKPHVTRNVKDNDVNQHEAPNAKMITV